MSPFDHLVSGALQSQQHDHRIDGARSRHDNRPVGESIASGVFRGLSAVEAALHRVRYL